MQLNNKLLQTEGAMIKQNLLLLFSVIVFILSVTFFVQMLDASDGGCYFCLNDGTPDNECWQSSGTGWTACMPGTKHCALGGQECCSGTGLCDNIF